MMYSVELKHWVDGQGWQESTTIDSWDSSESGAETVDEYVESDRFAPMVLADNEDYMVVISYFDGNETTILDQQWLSEVQ